MNKSNIKTKDESNKEIIGEIPTILRDKPSIIRIFEGRGDMSFMLRLKSREKNTFYPLEYFYKLKKHIIATINDYKERQYRKLIDQWKNKKRELFNNYRIKVGSAINGKTIIPYNFSKSKNLSNFFSPDFQLDERLPETRSKEEVLKELEKESTNSLPQI